MTDTQEHSKWVCDGCGESRVTHLDVGGTPVYSEWSGDPESPPEPVQCGEYVEVQSLLGRLREVEKERDEALAKYAFMVERAMNEKLDGYRELGARAAAAENARDEALRELNAARAELSFVHKEYREAPNENLTRDALEIKANALTLERDKALARCDVLRDLADQAAHEQGLAQRRMLEAQEARNALSRALKQAQEALAGIIRQCRNDCDRETYCGVCEVALGALPENYEV